MLDEIPYPLEYNHGVVFFNMTFWVRFNSKNPSKRGLFDQKMGFYSRKSPKTGLLKRGEVIFKSGAVLERIRYVFIFRRKSESFRQSHQDQIQSLGWVSHLHVAMYE